MCISIWRVAGSLQPTQSEQEDSYDCMFEEESRVQRCPHSWPRVWERNFSTWSVTLQHGHVRRGMRANIASK